MRGCQRRRTGSWHRTVAASRSRACHGARRRSAIMLSRRLHCAVENGAVMRHCAAGAAIGFPMACVSRGPPGPGTVSTPKQMDGRREGGTGRRTKSGSGATANVRTQEAIQVNSNRAGESAGRRAPAGGRRAGGGRGARCDGKISGSEGGRAFRWDSSGCPSQRPPLSPWGGRRGLSGVGASVSCHMSRSRRVI